MKGSRIVWEFNKWVSSLSDSPPHWNREASHIERKKKTLLTRERYGRGPWRKIPGGIDLNPSCKQHWTSWWSIRKRGRSLFMGVSSAKLMVRERRAPHHQRRCMGMNILFISITASEMRWRTSSLNTVAIAIAFLSKSKISYEKKNFLFEHNREGLPSTLYLLPNFWLFLPSFILKIPHPSS